MQLPWRKRKNRPTEATSLVEGALSADTLARVAALGKPSVRLIAATEADLGRTRIGGLPDLPPSAGWPHFKQVPHSFIAQIDLSMVPAFDDNPLPDAGILSFFYDSEQSVWGFDPADSGGWVVLHFPDPSALQARALPADLPDEGRFRSVPLALRLEQTKAPSESAELEQLGLSRDELLAYMNSNDDLDSDDGPVHRLLGHPDPIQGDMQLECQLVSNGLFCGDASGYEDPRAEALRPGAIEWVLLLQVDSEDAADMMWGDVGRLYYWITKDALRRRAWDEVRLVLQCG